MVESMSQTKNPWLLNSWNPSPHSPSVSFVCLYHCGFTTAQKMKFSIKDFFNKCDQIRSFLFCVVYTLRLRLVFPDDSDFSDI